MTKAVQINNDLWLKELLINPKCNPQFENFYKEELVRYCKIAKQEIRKMQDILEKENEQLKEQVKKLKDEIECYKQQCDDLEMQIGCMNNE